MDPIAVLQSRIEQLEAKLGLSMNGPVAPTGCPPQAAQQGDVMTSVTANLVQAAESIQNATAGHEKLNQAMNMATELNNYTDPNQIEHMQQNQNQMQQNQMQMQQNQMQMQQNQMHMQEVAASEPAMRQYHQCMHHCQQDGDNRKGTGDGIARRVQSHKGHGDGSSSSVQLACKCRVIQNDEVVADLHIYKPKEEAAPVLNSEAIQQVPQMQAQVNNMQMAANEAHGQVDQVYQGVQELAQACGGAAQDASEHFADIAQKVEQVEERKFPKRRNGLDY